MCVCVRERGREGKGRKKCNYYGCVCTFEGGGGEQVKEDKRGRKGMGVYTYIHRHLFSALVHV